MALGLKVWSFSIEYEWYTTVPCEPNISVNFSCVLIILANLLVKVSMLPLYFVSQVKVDPMQKDRASCSPGGRSKRLMMVRALQVRQPLSLVRPSSARRAVHLSRIREDRTFVLKVWSRKMLTQ